MGMEGKDGGEEKRTREKAGKRRSDARVPV